jgi:hypothetical protein
LFPFQFPPTLFAPKLIMFLVSLNNLDKYYLYVTIINRYGKDIVILTNHSDATYKRIPIPVGGRYTITSTLASGTVRIYFQAFDATSLVPLKINDKTSVSRTASKSQMMQFLYVETGQLCRLLQTLPFIGKHIQHRS